MTQKEIEYFKGKLVQEKSDLEQELSEVGKKNPDVVGEWQATAGDIDVDAADENELADKLEGIEGNTGIVMKLDEELMEVKAALERIDKGTFGLCQVCNKPIEKERLEANPSARISIKHGH